MTDAPALSRAPDRIAPASAGRMARLAASPRFQSWAARVPVLRSFVRREGAAMFDLVAGFCHAQILQAFVALEIPARLLSSACTADQLAQDCGVPPDRMTVLLNGAAALGLVRYRRDGFWALTVRGGALAGVPGLQDMIRHHAVLYRDLADPVAFFRGEITPELASFWPYVFGAAQADDPATARRYSRLMADSQQIVAADTLAAIDLRRVGTLMDVGGGTGAFLRAVAQAYPSLGLMLLDLPAVADAARQEPRNASLAARLQIIPASFRDDVLPSGADAISLVRVLYDHSDDTAADLLARAYHALPPGGQIIVSEPMAGGSRSPNRAGDAYFALYCMAMQTGRARTPAQIASLLSAAGFARPCVHPARRAYITQVVTAVKQG